MMEDETIVRDWRKGGFETLVPVVDRFETWKHPHVIASDPQNYLGHVGGGDMSGVWAVHKEGE
jgi:hypothetical protein